MESHVQVAVGRKRTIKESMQVALKMLPALFYTKDNLQRIIIKPSILDTNVIGNTSLKSLEAVVDIFRHVSLPIYIVESDNPYRMTVDAFRKSSYDTIASEHVILSNLTETDTVNVKMLGLLFQEHRLPSLLFGNKFLIDLATLKVNTMNKTMAASVKNLFGLLPEVKKSKYHKKLDDALLDLLSVCKPDLTIVDLSEIILEPRAKGLSKKVGGVIIGKDPVAVDAVAADLVGINPLKIPLLRKAHQLGLGEASIDKIKIHGTEHQISFLKENCKLL